MSKYDVNLFKYIGLCALFILIQIHFGIKINFFLSILMYLSLMMISMGKVGE